MERIKPLDVRKLRETLRKAALAGVILAILGAVGAVAGIEYTARPQFCNTCHIMEPYYESWENSSHGHIACVDCHFEPGLLETLEGKFKASTHLAKYITRTQGTRPWARVSDASCMRVDCHSRRLLEGRLDYRGVAFDHRHHLLEMRRGKRLRCTSCHSQIVQGAHMTVTESVCFICHFLEAEASESISDCSGCHGPPQDGLPVGELLFDHSEYTARGVGCTECHNRVVQGSGEVRREKCHICHDETAHIERIGETEEMHRIHVTSNKVECFECHDEIRHALPEIPRTMDPGRDCSDCHELGHGPQALVYRGEGGERVGVLPDPMFQTHVSCESCHRFTAPRASENPFRALPGPATEVGCMHCHDPALAKVVPRWRARVLEALNALGEGREAVDEALRNGGTLQGEAAGALRAAERNLALVEADGSHGIHNIRYVWRLLHAAGQGVNVALEAAGSPRQVALPPRVLSRHRCAETCHIDVAWREVSAGGRAFPHVRHAAPSMDCDACHDLQAHGRTLVGPSDCTSCHHGERTEERSCTDCHGDTVRFMAGEGSPGGESIVSDMGPDVLDCTDCHDRSRIGREGARQALRQLCIDCHGEDYAILFDDWLEETKEGVEDLEKALAREDLDAATRKRLEENLAYLRKAGPLHNPELAAELSDLAK